MNEMRPWLYIDMVLTTVECVTVSLLLNHLIGPCLSLLVIFNIVILFNFDLYQASQQSRFLRISVVFTVLLILARIIQVILRVLLHNWQLTVDSFQVSLYWTLIYQGILSDKNNFKMAYYAGYPFLVILIQFIELYILWNKIKVLMISFSIKISF